MLRIESIKPCNRRQVEDHIYRKVDLTIGRQEYSIRNALHFRRTANIIRGSRGISVVAVAGDVVVGYLLMDISERSGRKHAEITHLHVDSAYRRKRVATNFMKKVRSDLMHAGVTSISVVASPRNEAAIAFYESIGMRAATLELECDIELFCNPEVREAA